MSHNKNRGGLEFDYVIVGAGTAAMGLLHGLLTTSRSSSESSRIDGDGDGDGDGCDDE